MTDTTALQTQVAFLEDTVQALDAALAKQQQQIMDLERALEGLFRRVTEHAERLSGAADGASEPPPPHY